MKSLNVTPPQMLFVTALYPSNPPASRRTAENELLVNPSGMVMPGMIFPHAWMSKLLILKVKMFAHFVFLN